MPGLAESGGLEPVPEGVFDNEALGRHARDLGSDRPGRSFASSGGGVRHAIEPHHDARKMEKHKFAEEAVRFLDDACAADRFDRG